MSKALADILSDGSLVDNTVHSSKDGYFRSGHRGAPVEIRQGRKWNNPDSVWPLMRKAADLPTHSSKLVFRVPEPDYEHNTDDAFIRLDGFGPLDVTLTTGNLIGCVKAGGYTLRVSSRFGDEFLKYIIADADGFVELPDHGGTERGGYEWLLVYLWKVKLKKAFRLGLPKSYETRSERLTQVRGRLDPLDYCLNHQLARYRCTYREHSYDNDPTRLIARTLQHLDSHDFLRDTHALSQTFQIATQGRHCALQKLLSTKPVRNPYYADYNPVIFLSKQILRNELADFGNETEASAFFFDVSMLFEYFIRQLLKRKGLALHNKTSRRWTIPSGLVSGYTQRNLIPDLVFDANGGTYVFDVKYKAFDFSHGVSREDLFQIHTYIGQAGNEQKVKGCGFIYPIRESRWGDLRLDFKGGVFSERIKQGGREIPFHVFFLMIPEQEDTPDQDWRGQFSERFRKSVDSFESAFVSRIELKGRAPQ